MVDGILYLLGIALHTVHSLGNIASQHLTTIKRNKTTLLILYVKVGFACYLTIETIPRLGEISEPVSKGRFSPKD